MKILAMLVLLAGMVTAFSVAPGYIETKFTGNASLPALSVGIMLDCDSKAATVTVRSNDTGLPVSGAKTYMFYTDYGYNALPNPGTTDSQGVAVMPVPGNIHYLTALFILRTDAQGFRTEEVEYTYEKCFAQPPQNQSNASQPSPPPKPECSAPSDCADFQYCDASGKCQALSGNCGFASNHTWVPYECGTLPGCPQCTSGLSCVDNKCKANPAPPDNTTNGSGNNTAPPGGGKTPPQQGVCPLGALMLGLIFLKARS